MKKLTKYSKTMLCMALILILSIGATLGITLTFFGDSKSGSTEISLGSSIYFDGEKGVSFSNLPTSTVVAGQTMDVDVTFKIKAGEIGTASSAVLRATPVLQSQFKGASISLTQGKTFPVKINGTISTDAVMVVYRNILYLVNADDHTSLYEFTPTVSGITVSFTTSIKFSLDITSALSGQNCNLKIKAVVVQSHVYTSSNTRVPLKITEFKPYFENFDPVQYETEEDKYIYFGSFPQTIKSSSVSITSDPVDSNGYYTGSDGAKYAKVTATIDGAGTEYNASDGTTMTTGTDYYFKVEPLKWRVLSNDGTTVLMVCDNIIAAMAYDAGSDNNYKNSDLRAFLVGDFYNNAFTTSEQALIQTTTVDNSAASTGVTSNSYACENTNDKIFALSKAEAMNTAYGFTNSDSSDTNRTWKGSDYAKANYLWVDGSNTNSYVWLRSPLNYVSNYAWSVFSGGHIHDYYVYGTDLGVVPALNISL